MSHAHTIHTIRFVIGIIGNVTSFFLFFSPAPTFWRIIKNKSVEGFHPYPYLAAVLNCAFWIFYGLPFNHPDSTLVVTINSIGLALELIYLIIFLCYTHNKMRAKIGGVFALEVAFFACMAAVDLLALHNHAKRIMFTGILSVVFGIVLYGSPLSIMRQVVKTKNAEFLPVWLCLAGFSNGIIWAVYAMLEFDPYILTGNGVGSLLGLIQLILWNMYRSNGGDGDKEKLEGKSSEVELPKRVSV